MSGDSVLALHLFAGLLWSAHCLTRDASARNNRSGSCAAALPQPENTWRINTFLGRYGDFLVIGWLLPPFEILVYCLARAISLSAECVSITLLQRVDQTSSLFDASKSSQQFLRAAARVNLGLFLVGCGSMVTVVVIAPLPARLILGDTMTLMSVLPWVLLAFSVPTICGATSLFLGKSQMYLADNLLQWTSTATGNDFTCTNCGPKRRTFCFPVCRFKVVHWRFGSGIRSLETAHTPWFYRCLLSTVANDLTYYEFRMQSTCRFDALENINHVSR